MSQDAIVLWREKLEFLEGELAKATQAAQKFELQKHIDECRGNIARLENTIPKEAISTQGRYRQQPDRPAAPSDPNMIKILILASNPRHDLKLDREIRDLKAVIGQSANRQRFEVEDALAVRVGDLQALLLQHRPQIVHFCGHGSGQQGLVFEGSDGSEQWVRAEALADLFRLFAQDVGCVLLNACYSETQADAIVTHIDYVIGMNREIRDDAAIAFSKGFYRGLGHEWSVEQSFELGCNAIQLEITGSSRVRSMATEAERKAVVVNAIQHTTIPEHLQPILKKKLNPTGVSSAVSALSEEKRATIHLEVAQSLAEHTAADQYRAKVREFLADREISKLEEIRLESLRKNLELSEPEAQQILDEVLAPILKAQDEYKEMVIRLIEANLYPFSDKINAELQDHIRDLGLNKNEVDEINKSIFVKAEKCDQQTVTVISKKSDTIDKRNQQTEEQLKQDQDQVKIDYEQKLKSYEKEFIKIETLNENNIQRLNSFWKELELKEADIKKIEKPIKESIVHSKLEIHKRWIESNESRHGSKIGLIG